MTAPAPAPVPEQPAVIDAPPPGRGVKIYDRPRRPWLGLNALLIPILLLSLVGAYVAYSYVL